MNNTTLVVLNVAGRGLHMSGVKYWAFIGELLMQDTLDITGEGYEYDFTWLYRAGLKWRGACSI